MINLKEIINNCNKYHYIKIDNNKIKNINHLIKNKILV